MGKVKTAVTIDNPDGGKLAIKEEDFDKAIKPYVEKIPAAATALKEAVDHYIDLVNGRNKLLINYNSLFIKKADLEKQVAQRTAELNHVDVQYKLDSGGDVALPVYLSFMQQAYNSVRDYAAWLIYEETRAYEYWSLTDKKLELSDVRVSFLDTSHIRLKQDIMDKMGSTVTVPTPFKDIGVTISRRDNPSAFAQLPTTKKLSLRIDINDPAFENFYAIRVATLSVTLPNTTQSQGALTLRLLHNGESPFYDEAGALKDFTHEPHVIGFQYDYRKKEVTSPGAIGDSAAGFANLSPFTLWTIDFDLLGNDWLDLSKLDQVIITFDGTWMIKV